jgi:hypothetical protein
MKKVFQHKGLQAFFRREARPLFSRTMRHGCPALARLDLAKGRRQERSG